MSRSHKPPHARSRKTLFRGYRSVASGLAASGLAVLFVLGAIHSSSESAPFASSETHFTDTSHGGLQIVPASGGSVIAQPEMYPVTCQNNGYAVLSWGSVPGAQYYRLRYNNSPLACKNGWYSANPGECDFDYHTGTSDAIPIVYDHTYNWWVHAWDGTTSSATQVAFSCPLPAPSCSLSLNPTTVNQPGSSTLSWNSSLSSTFYVSNVASVTPNVAGSTNVAPSGTTEYQGTVTNEYGTRYCSATLTVNRWCTFNGSTITHGNSVTAYQSSSVAYGSSCVAESRTCSDGTLSGSYTNASCSIAEPANCSFNSTPVAHGNSVTAYQAATVPFGSSCTSQSRSCTNGALSGSYTNASCSVTPAASCTFHGNTIAHNASVTAYLVAEVAYGSSCTSQSRICSNGTLSGSYVYASCAVTAPNCDTPPTLTADGNGYILSAGLSSRWINKFTYSFCVSNSSGLQYFVPTKSSTEVQYFYNAIPGLTGVTQSGL